MQLVIKVKRAETDRYKDIVEQVTFADGKIFTVDSSDLDQATLPIKPGGEVPEEMAYFIRRGYNFIAIIDHIDKSFREIILDDSEVFKGNWLLGKANE